VAAAVRTGHSVVSAEVPSLILPQAQPRASLIHSRMYASDEPGADAVAAGSGPLSSPNSTGPAALSPTVTDQARLPSGGRASVNHGPNTSPVVIQPSLSPSARKSSSEPQFCLV